MNDFFEERNFDDKALYYQIDIIMSDNTCENAEKISEVICKYCELPEGYGIKNVKARLLLCYEQDKSITIDCKDYFDVYTELIECLKDLCPTFSRDNFWRKKKATFWAKVNK